MKSIKNIYYTACLTGLLALSTSSCTDWLTIYPQDRVVEENFWEDKNDLEGVRYAAYRQMASTVSSLVLWGDLRSDSFKENGAFRGNMDTHNMYIEIISGMPDSSMGVFDWSGVYTTINYCNKVLQHGEEVLAKDKQFTSGEWYQMRAEMKALRALNYFYLIRAFKDVPYTTKVINKDSEVEHFPLTNQLAVLDSIINDCESVKGQARNRFSDIRDTKGLITNSAIYAMLADMYLWRGSLHEGRHGKKGKDLVNGEEVNHDVSEDYQKAADYAELSLQKLAEQNLEETSAVGFSTETKKTENYGLTNCDMIKNDFTGVSQSTYPKFEAQTSIFQKGNSTESIFELQYSVSDGLKNTIVNSLFGTGDGTHFQVSNESLNLIYDGGVTSDKAGGGMWDSRIWVCCQDKLTTGNSIDVGSGSGSGSGGNGYFCMKYHLPTSTSLPILNMTGAGTSRDIKSLRYTSTEYNNWIVYRMTDVMLIEAEAYACLAKNKTDANAKKATQICNAVHRRSYYNYRNDKTPGLNVTTAGDGDIFITARANKTGVNPVDAIIGVMNERQIELIGEGKRWFDLVRFAERSSGGKKNDGKNGDPEDPRESTEKWPIENGYTGMRTMVEMFLGAGSNSGYATTLMNRFKNRYGLYCPIYYMEVKASEGAIEQNPVWNKSKYEQ